jgi:Polyketide cyclase / dehydrase and lipid transport
MSTETRHLSVPIDRPLAQVYAFVSDPENMPRWARGLGGDIVREDGRWYVETPGGRAQVTFTPANDFGVLDHVVLTPTGQTVYVPMRVIADGDGSEVVLTLRREPGMSDADFDRDAGLMTADLAQLKQVLDTA